MPGPVSDEAAKGRSSLLSPVVLCRGTGTRREGGRREGEREARLWICLRCLGSCFIVNVVFVSPCAGSLLVFGEGDAWECFLHFFFFPYVNTQGRSMCVINLDLYFLF